MTQIEASVNKFLIARSRTVRHASKPTLNNPLYLAFRFFDAKLKKSDIKNVRNNLWVPLILDFELTNDFVFTRLENEPVVAGTALQGVDFIRCIVIPDAG